MNKSDDWNRRKTIAIIKWQSYGADLSDRARICRDKGLLIAVTEYQKRAAIAYRNARILMGIEGVYDEAE